MKKGFLKKLFGSKSDRDFKKHSSTLQEVNRFAEEYHSFTESDFPQKTEEFKKRLRKRMKENREAFEGKYKDELKDLMGLSKAEIGAITHGLTGLEIYDQLLTVVKEASRVNLSQAQLKSRITELGEVAMAIAKKVTTLAALFL